MNKISSYYFPKKGEKIDCFFGKEYEVIEKVGEGSYGQVFKVLHVGRSKLLIAKRQKKKHTGKTNLQNEYKILCELKGVEGFPWVGNFYSQPEQEYFFMDCLGLDLEVLVGTFGTLELSTVKRIGFCIVSQLEKLHMAGYLHRDIKTQNILVGDRNRCHSFFLIDYGISMKFLKNGKQISPRKYSGLVGTARFASIAAHQADQQSPKDDLQSLGYVLCYCLGGRLKWQNLEEDNKVAKFRKIKQQKQKISLENLACDYRCLQQYFKYVKGLKYYSEVCYDYLKSLLHEEGREKSCFEWCHEACSLNNHNDTHEFVQAKLIKCLK